MPRRLLALNALLVATATALVLYIGWALTVPGSAPAPEPAVAARNTPTPPAASRRAPAPRGAYGVIASRNLFHPSRSEVAGAPAGGSSMAGLPRPYLYGVVLREGASIAYLEDPVTKRVAGYRIGDTIAGGTVQRIAADRVVLHGPEGPMDVRLHDPTKPRPAEQPTPEEAPADARPGAPPVATPLPRVPPQFQPPAGVQSPPGVFSPGRRVLPPTLLRRLPPRADSDATPR